MVINDTQEEARREEARREECEGPVVEEGWSHILQLKAPFSTGYVNT